MRFAALFTLLASLVACTDNRTPCQKVGAKARALVKKHPNAEALVFMMGDGSVYEEICRQHKPSETQFECMRNASSVEALEACVPDLVERYLRDNGLVDPPGEGTDAGSLPGHP